MPPDTDTPNSHRSQAETVWLIGSILLYGGIGLLIVAGLDRISTVPFPLPEFWYSNRIFWPFLAVVSIAIGLQLLRHESHIDWQPTHPGLRFRAVVLYTRENCHLCEDAKHLLRIYRQWIPAPVEVDIDTDPELRERFNTCVPVVECDGKVRFRGRVDEVLLRRLIQGQPPVA